MGHEAELLQRIAVLIPLLFSLSVHEWAHARTAWQLGDDTAALLGRLTINPLAHIDPVGTLLLPLLGVPFGWAKPVPVNPLRFRRSIAASTGMWLTAAAGPLANIVIALLSIVVFAVLIATAPELLKSVPGLADLFVILIVMNVGLGVFNLLPIPPLDGSRIVDALVPDTLRPAWESFRRIGALVLIALIVLPNSAGFSLFVYPRAAAFWLLDALIHLLA